MVKKSRLERVEKSLRGKEDYKPLHIIWSDEDLEYEGRKVSREEWDQLVKEGKIKVITWPDGDGDL